jgi:outer membrane protein OmpA-like peptidoglycan-associated protein
MTRIFLLVLTLAMPLTAAAESFQQPAHAKEPLKVATVHSFDFGRIYVHTDERHELWRIAKLWLQRPAWWRITVEGHGYVANDEEASIELGEKRAKRVRDLLVKYGVDPRFVTAVGHSRKQPGRYVDVLVDTCERCRR